MATPAEEAPATEEKVEKAEAVLEAESQDAETQAEKVNPKGPAEPAE